MNSFLSQLLGHTLEKQLVFIKSPFFATKCETIRKPINLYKVVNQDTKLVPLKLNLLLSYFHN